MFFIVIFSQFLYNYFSMSLTSINNSQPSFKLIYYWILFDFIFFRSMPLTFLGILL